MYKVAWLARFPKGLGHDEARRRWRDEHGPMCLEVPGVERYVQNQVLNPIGAEGVTEGVDAARLEFGTDTARGLQLAFASVLGLNVIAYAWFGYGWRRHALVAAA